MTSLSTARPYSRTLTNYSVVGLYGTRLYAINAINGHWAYSDDGIAWVDTLQSPSVNPGNGALIQLVNHGAYLIAVSSDGKLYRNVRDLWTNWATITVSAAPAGTTGRPDICASNGTYLFYGNYNASLPGGAHIWRSADNGAAWVEVLNAPTARHVHSILVDPGDRTKIYATLGDSGQAGNGFYASVDSGATWTRLSSNRYGIGMAIGGTPRLIMLEGDGAAQPHIMSLDYARVAADVATTTNALISPSSPTWYGTGRGIALTPDGNLFYFTTGESGAVGPKDAVWLAQGPDFSTVVLLEDLTGNVPAAYQMSVVYGNTGTLFNYRYQYVVPMFAQAAQGLDDAYRYGGVGGIGPIGTLLPPEVIV